MSVCWRESCCAWRPGQAGELSSQESCGIQHWETQNPAQDFGGTTPYTSVDWLGSSIAEKGLGGLGGQGVGCEPAVCEAVPASIASRSREGCLPLSSALGRHIQSAGFSFRLPSTGKSWTCYGVTSKGPSDEMAEKGSAKLFLAAQWTGL